MSFQGHVMNGVVHLDNGATLPEGATVCVELLSLETKSRSENEVPTIYETLAICRQSGRSAARHVGQPRSLPLRYPKTLMKPIFADTSFYVALFQSRRRASCKGNTYSQRASARL